MGETETTFTDEDGILWKGRYWGMEILLQKAKEINPEWTPQLFALVDEDTISDVMAGTITPVNIKPPEPDFKSPEEGVAGTVTGERPAPPKNPYARELEAQGAVEAKQPPAPVAPEALPVPAIPEMPAPPALPESSGGEPASDYKKLCSIIDAAAELADSSADTAKGLLESHNLAGAFWALHPDKAQTVYGEKESVAKPGPGSVILEVEAYQNCLHIITTDGVLTFLGNNIQKRGD